MGANWQYFLSDNHFVLATGTNAVDVSHVKAAEVDMLAFWWSYVHSNGVF